MDGRIPLPGGRGHIRAATPDDLPALLDLWRALEDVQGRFRVLPVVEDAEDRIRAILSDALASPDARALVAEIEGHPVGMTVAQIDEPDARSLNPIRAVELSRVVVREDARGSGIGAALTEAAAAFGRERGATHLIAKTFSGNEAAGAFWRRIGFTPRVETLVRPIEPR